MVNAVVALAVAVALFPARARPQTSRPVTAQAAPAPARADVLRGAYGPHRANNDLLYYHLDVRVDPEKKFLSGKNTIRFKMLKDDARIQLDLHAALNIDKILFGAAPLAYERDAGAVFVTFPRTLKAGRVYSIDFHYSGNPAEAGRFGGITFRKDPSGRDWVNTSCQDVGASVWWPNKDQWRDEVEGMRISVAVPNGLVDVSNGKFVGKTDLGDGYTRWDWHVQYPINNYNVSLNIGNYTHFADRLGDLPLDFYVLPENLERAKKQFAQSRGTLEAFRHYFGEYPFERLPEVHERLQVEGQESAPHRRPPRRQRHPAVGPVLQRRALPAHAPQRRRRRKTLAVVAPGFLPAFQVPELDDRGRG
ncbi:MAG: hypothetical protein LC795_18055 [Acidobacteria bacterium]|nr:hypothetical protein [Acidobacteriota bacterium]